MHEPRMENRKQTSVTLSANLARTDYMYTDISPASNVDAFHDALFGGAIGHLKSFPEMPAIVAFTKAFLEERLAPLDPVRIHEMERRPS